MTDQPTKILLVESDPAPLVSRQTFLSPNSEVIAVPWEQFASALEQVATGSAAGVVLGPEAAQIVLELMAATAGSAQEIAERHAQERTDTLAQAIEVLREQVLETQRVEREIRRENQELALLNSIPAAVSTSLELTEILLLLKQQLSQQLGVPGGCIYTYDPQQEKFELKECWGLPNDTMPKINVVPASSYPANEILSTRKPFLVAEIKKDPFYMTLQLDQTRAEWESCLGVPLLADGAMQGVVVLFSCSAFNEAQISFYTSFGKQVGAAFHHARLFEQFFAARERTQVLSQRLVAIQEEERRNLARELHDEIGQILTGLKLMLEMSLRLPPAESQANVQEAQALVGELMSKVRQISLDLRPGMLDDLGLLPALLWYFERYMTQTKVQVNFTHSGLEGRRFASEIETAAYRIVQEALTNVARYAQVKQAQVRAWADEDILSVEIKDAGVGFNPDAALKANTSSGLAGMGERARLLGGGLTIESEIGAGSCVTAHLPLWDEAR
ncbi:MAG: GAF domain-containing sensor histidine kinase [Acidobacteria bacterium]|nr:GAF domain-containing sensor histidine kinase [Acidobacteriota bacterium]